MIHLVARLGLVLAAGLLATAASAQRFSEGYTFLKSVRDRDGNKVTEMLSAAGSRVVNSRDVGNGETALQIVIGRQDLTWLGFLLAKGADPNLVDGNGNPPLLLAVESNFIEGVQRLIKARADVNLSNKAGETPLIRAVQRRNLPLVRALVAAGANPDRADLLAGMSARDYARADTRTPQLMQALDAAKGAPKAGVAGPRL